MQLERDQEHRSGDVPRPHPHADGDAAKDSGIEVHGDPERKEPPDAYEKFPELKYKYRNREFWC